MNDETEFKKWASKKIKQSEYFNKNTKNVYQYFSDSTIRQNNVKLQEGMELVIDDETYTYNEIKTMMSVLKEIAKEKRPEEFI